MEIRVLNSDYDALQALDTARERPIMIVTPTSLFNEHEAAEFFGVRVAYFNNHYGHMLPKVWTHYDGSSKFHSPRYRFSDLQTMKAAVDAEREKLMQELTEESERFGFYDDLPTIRPIEGGV